MSSRWSYTLPSAADLIDSEEYSPNEAAAFEVLYMSDVYFAGETFETDDACEMRAFLKAYLSQHPERSVLDRTAGFYDNVKRACPLAIGNDDEWTGRPHDNVMDQPSGSTLDGPPDGGDSPGSLGAHDPGPVAELDESAPEQGEPTSLSPADQYYYPQEPQSEGDIADRLAGEGTSNSDIDDQIQRARQGEPLPGDPHPFRSGDEEKDQVVAADPVLLFSGEFYIQKVDLEIPARGFPFRLVRTYQSGRPLYGPLGFNWDHNYNVYLRELNDGRAAIRTGQLHEDIYELNEQGKFEPPRKVYATLEISSDSFGTVTDYTLTHRGGMKYVFARPAGWPDGERIPLLRIEDSNNNSQELRYNASGLLELVIDTVQREIKFTYDSCNHLSAVTDFTGRSIRYLYAGFSDQLVGVTTPGTDEYPEGLTTCYEYDEYQSHPVLQHNIVRVIDPRGETVVENTYGADPSVDGFNRVTRQYYLEEEFLYTYTRLRYIPPLSEYINDSYLRVEVAGSCAPYQVYTFNFRGNLLEHRFRLCSDGTYRIWAMTCRYNDQGEAIEIYKPNGLALKYIYDQENGDPKARGNLLSVVLSSPPTSFLLDRLLISYTYEDHFQNVKTSTDERGNATTFVYDYEENSPGNGVGNLIRVEHPEVTLPDSSKQQSHEHFEYNEFGQLTRYTSAEGRLATYTYYETGIEAGYLEKFTLYPGGNPKQISYAYNKLGQVAAVTDSLGNITAYETNELNQLRSIVLPEVEGRKAKLRFEYNQDGLMSRMYYPRGNYHDELIGDAWIVHDYIYDVAGRLIKVIVGGNTASSRSWTYQRDSEDRVLEMTDPLNREFKFKYDERGLLLEAVALANTSEPLVSKYNYDRNGNLEKSTDWAGLETQFAYDSWDRLIKTTLPAHSEALGTIVSLVYGEGNEISTTTIEGIGDVARSRKVLSTQTLQYDEKGRPYQQNLNNLVFETWYDADDLPTKYVDQRDQVSQTTYNGSGQLSTVTDPLGNRNSFIYDAVGNLREIIDEDVDARGNISSFAYQFDYDQRNRLVQTTDPLGNSSRAVYDDRNLIIRTINALGHVVDLEYDLNGAMTRSLTTAGNPPATVEDRWTRDLLGRCTSFKDPEGKETFYEWTSHDQPRKMIFPDGSVHEKTYDHVARLIQEKTPNASNIFYSYDGAGSISKATFLPGPGVSTTNAAEYIHDGLGRTIRITKGVNALDLSYDAFGRIILEEYKGDQVQTIYDDINGLVDFLYPDGRTDRFTADALGRLHTLHFLKKGSADMLGSTLPNGTPLLEMQYVGPDRIDKRLLANATQTSFDYDAGRRLTSIEHKDTSRGAALASIQYMYDAMNQRRLVYSNPTPGQAVLYGYDELTRLIAAYEDLAVLPPPNPVAQSEADNYLAAIDPTTAASEIIYTLDKCDNRLKWEIRESAGTKIFTATFNDLHQLTTLEESSTSGTTTKLFEYDGNGNLIKDSDFSYLYDALDQLIEVHRISDGSLVLRQEFDPMGRVSSRESGLGQREILSNSGLQTVQRRDGTTGVVLEQTTYANGPDEIIARNRSGDNLWLHHDALLSLVAVTRDDGTPVERYSYDPFGQPRAWSADGTTEIPNNDAQVAAQFGGRPFLPELELYDLRARIYNPRLGRFFQRDPAGYRDSSSPYVYTSHDPVNWIDPTGAYIESMWDALSLGLGVASFSYNISQGNYGAATIDAIGIAVDGAALALPVPGGAGAAIKAVRAGEGLMSSARVAKNAYNGYEVGRGVRAAQAGAQLLDTGQGIYQASSEFSQGNYGMSAFYYGLSTLGARGAFGKAAQVLHPRYINKVYTLQGNMVSIYKSRRIWGVTEGSVYGMSFPNAPSWRSGLQANHVKRSQGAYYVFEGAAASVFERHEVTGIFSAWKAVAGQYKAPFGDLAVDLNSRSFQGWNKSLQRFVFQVNNAEALVGDFEDRSMAFALSRLWGRRIFDFISTAGIVPGGGLVVLYALGLQPNTKK